MTLESGKYHIFVVDYTPHPPLSRPLGLSESGNRNQVVILPAGASAPTFEVEKVSGDKVKLRLSGRPLHPSGDHVQAGEGTPFEWKVLRGAPSPPPMGKDGFS
ncbi:hypothetical protein HWV62_13862 [Athelia sp. TMB]|nr:hypothetical protein HWV62_13862 [Athelia sp. TMB]